MSVAGGRGLGSQYYSLRWNNHPVNLVTVFTGLYQVSQQPASAAADCSVFVLRPENSHFQKYVHNSYRVVMQLPKCHNSYLTSANTRM